jgi:GTP cyclohydrolase I-like protein
MAPERDLEAHVRAMLAALDPEPTREGLERTPERVARALTFLTKGYAEDPRQVINGALFAEDYSEMILVKDIDFYSLCPSSAGRTSPTSRTTGSWASARSPGWSRCSRAACRFRSA